MTAPKPVSALEALGNLDPNKRPLFILSLLDARLHPADPTATVLVARGLSPQDLPLLQRCVETGISWSLRAIDSHIRSSPSLAHQEAILRLKARQ